MTSTNKIILITAMSALLIGLVGGNWFGGRETSSPLMNSPAIDSEQKNKPMFYRNPMNPAITSPVPAQDEMGMDYIPVYADDNMGSEPMGTVKIDSTTVQNIGVRTAAAEHKVLSHTVRALGRVDYNEKRMTRLHPKIEGWVDELRVESTGESVKKNTILLSIYSPQLVASQQEYLLALDSFEALKSSPYKDVREGAQALVRVARERLVLLDVPEHQIHELEQNRQIKKTLHIHSPFDGVVVKLGVRDGQYVTPQTELYTLADLAKIWVHVDVYEQELPWVRLGDQAEMKLAAKPGEVFKGQVSFIYPFAETQTRTVKVRLEFDNPGRVLKPGLFADVTVHASRQEAGVVIPDAAVVRSGTRDQVFVVRAPGKYEPREVKLGVSSNGMVQVLQGVRSGEQVVTSSQFMIDSESKLREATSKMMEINPVGDHPMHSMDKDDMSMDTMEMDMDDMDMSDMDMGSDEPSSPEHAHHD